MRLKNLFNPASMGVNMPTSLQNPALDMTGEYGEEPPNRINFGPTNLPPSPPTPTPSIPPPDEEPDIASMMKGMYNPSTMAADKFAQLLSQYPEREKPSILRRIGAMIVDYTKGPQAGQAMMDQGFNEKLTDWKNQVGPAQQAANLERYENVNDRTMAYQHASTVLKERALEQKAQNEDRRAKVYEGRAAVYKWKTENPAHKFIFPPGGNVMAIDPFTNQTTTLTDDEGKPIPTGIMTETDKINANQKNRIAQIQESGGQARKTEEVRQENRLDVVEARGTESRKTKSTPSGSGAAGKPETASNKKIREYLAARELFNSRPELRPFIHLDGSGPNSFKLDIPEWGKWAGASGPTRDQYNEIQDYIFGDLPTVQIGKSATGSPTGGVKILSITPVK